MGLMGSQVVLRIACVGMRSLGGGSSRFGNAPMNGRDVKRLE